ncbi:hypothetical protein Asp14428_67930 [Actinoplanes sp. NBRC 14428]|nr:hypothetical protein Asp14428_67930 [Actinoplanes sp. NBRC 14428]
MLPAARGVRERLWLLAHDDGDETGLRPHLDVRALSIGLVAASLTDLLLQGMAAVHEGRVHAIGRGPDPAGDLIASGILTAIRAEGPCRLSEILRGARADAVSARFNPYLRLYSRTRATLVAAGVLIEHRRTLRPTRYRLCEPDTIARHRSQFNHRLVYHRRQSDPGTDCLCALVWALNIHRALLTPYTPGEADAILSGITGRIPARIGPGAPLAGVPELARGVRDAVGDLATAAF